METIDRRTRYTRMVIAEAFFSLLKQKGFTKMTVTDICKEAQINRGTFYLHHEDKFALLRDLIDEALDAEPPRGSAPEAFCQRVPQTNEARLLYEDPDTFSYVAQRMIERSAATAVPAIMERTGLPEEKATILFTFIAHGNLAVNRQLGWEESKAYTDAQKLIGNFVDGGYGAVGILDRVKE